MELGKSDSSPNFYIKIIKTFNYVTCLTLILLVIYSYLEQTWSHRVLPQSRPKIYAALDSWGGSVVTNTSENIQNKSKIILLYTPWYGEPFWFYPDQTQDGIFYSVDSKTFSCPHKCQFTHNKSFVFSADMVVLSVVDLAQKKPRIPKRRPRRQIWTGFICESPLNFNVGKTLRKNDDLFNWTTSYRRDSDVYWPSGHFYKLRTPNSNALGLPSLAELKKKKLVSWLVSNCETQSGREEVVRVMQSFIPVDVYGKCGALKCPQFGDCRSYLGSNYKFYLSFENSLCLQYVSEKFYDPFEHGMIPVTYGLGQYEQIAPPHSFINILDFPTMKALTDYLLFLDQNDQEYLKYFEWKRHYVVHNDPTSSGLCHLCVKLWQHHSSGEPGKTCPSFHKWWTTKPTRIGSIPPRNESRASSLVRFVEGNKICSIPKQIVREQKNCINFDS